MPALLPGVQPADDHVGRVGEQFQQRELHAVRRPAFDRPADERLAVVLEHLADEQRVQQRDRVARGALLGRRGDDEHRAELLKFGAQCPQTRGVDAVVVGEQYSHGWSPFSLGHSTETGGRWRGEVGS